MNRGPVLTLLAVLALGVALLGINIAAQEPTPAPVDVAAPAAPPAPPPSSTPPPSTTTATASNEAPAAPFPAKAKYVGHADTAAGPVPVSVTIDSDRAKVYVCDGKNIEAWLQGFARDGAVDATGKNSARLTAQHEGDHVSGTVALPGHPSWTFTATATQDNKAGIYRARRGGRTSGWIVGPGDRGQVGLSHDAAGAIGPAMPLDLGGPLPLGTAPVDATTDVLTDS